MFDKENKRYQKWINTENLNKEVKEQLLNASDEELEAAFNIELEFGTAGIRGVLGAGPGRFNIYTIKKVTRAYSRLLRSKYSTEQLLRGVVIGHDNRKNSKIFAQEVANILTSYGIKAYLFKENNMKPTPVVSFSVRDLNCIGGVVITASHNPAIYNGYKIYDENGCQLTDVDTKQIAENMNDIGDILDWYYKTNFDLICEVSDRTIENYKKMIYNLQFYPNEKRNDFELIYSAVNGTGTEFVPPILTSNGYKIVEVKEHAFEDATFKNVVNPNPEFDPAWKIPLTEYANKYKDAKLIIMTDPDADRIGLAVKHNNQWIRLDGNQTGPLLIHWKLSQMKKFDKLPKKPALYSSFVTSDLGDRVAKEKFGVNIVKTLTGFKWMGSSILRDKGKYNFVFAYEESYGYVLDSSTLDKDGVQAAIMLAEMGWYYHTHENKTLIDVLNDIFNEFCYYHTYTLNLNFKPEEIKLKIDPIMELFRKNPPQEFGGEHVMEVEDYIGGLYKMPGQNLLKFYLEDGSWFAIRPSGTEPKIKIYFVVVDKTEGLAKQKIDRLLKDFNDKIDKIKKYSKGNKMKKTLKDINVAGKTVLLRADLNVPIRDNKITDDNRIKAVIPTINYLLANNAKIVIFSHLSRIKTEEDKKAKSLKIVCDQLSKELNKPIKFINQTRGQQLESTIKDLKNQELLMFENTRFEDVENGQVVKNESKNNPELGKYWARLGDVFVNDAFGTAHREHASNVGIAKNIKESCVGFLVEKELTALSQGIDNPAKPFVAIVGGAKVSDKIDVIDNLLLKADKILIGGGMAYTFLKAQGHKIGNSLIEEDKLDLASAYLKKSANKIVLPIDSLCANEFEDVQPKNFGLDIDDGYMGLDIGPKTIELYKNILKTAKTVAWNGPMGVFEFENYKKGTVEVCQAIANLKNVFTLIGGGDSAAAAIQFGFENSFSHISTGGGASLMYMEGKPLSGIEAIANK